MIPSATVAPSSVMIVLDFLPRSSLYVALDWVYSMVAPDLIQPRWFFSTQISSTSGTVPAYSMRYAIALPTVMTSGLVRFMFAMLIFLS